VRVLRFLLPLVLLHLLFVTSAYAESTNTSDVVAGRAFEVNGYQLFNREHYYYGYTKVLTDGDVGTGIGTGDNVRAFWTELEEPTKIYGYASNNGGSTSYHGFNIAFYDVNRNVLFSGTLASSNGTRVDLPTPIENVKYVGVLYWLQYTYYTNWIGEVKVYGEYNDQNPPNKPLGLTFTPGTEKGILSWSANTENDLAGYNVYKADGIKVNDALITSTTYEVNMVPEVTESFYITAVDASGNESIPSDLVSGFAYPALIKPVIKKMVPDATSLHVEWESSYQSFSVYLDGLKVYETTAKKADITGLNAGQSYSVFVRAVDKYGRSIDSDAVVFETKPLPPPVKPDLTYTATPTTITLNWSKVGVWYQVWNIHEGQTYKLHELEGTTYTITGLEPETESEFYVVAIDPYGREVQSDTITARTLPPPPPVNPQLRQVAVSYDSITVTWTAVGVKYDLYLDDVLVKTTKGIVDRLTGLDPDTTYRIKVVAVDQFGRENPSNELTSKTTPAPTRPDPSPPTDPPPVSNSKNPDLNKGNDHLIQGMKDTKDQGMNVIMLAILIIIMVFGILWLIKLFKKKMSKATASRNSGRLTGSGRASVPGRSSGSGKIPAVGSADKAFYGKGTRYQTAQIPATSGGPKSKKIARRGGKRVKFYVQSYRKRFPKR